MNDISYGEYVRIVEKAPSSFFPGRRGSICGIRKIVDDRIAEKLCVDVGTIMYIVEFEDGKSLEIPDKWLEKM